MPDRSTLIKFLVIGGIAVVLGLVLWRTLGKKDKFLGYGEDYEESDEEMFEDEAEDYEDSSDEEGFEDEEESYEESSDEEGFEDEEESYDEEEDYEDGDDDTYA